MSKYLYTTVYEQFTGEKPPEPKADPERKARRTHGHPYRMRHNMRLQEQEAKASHKASRIERHPANDNGPSIGEIADMEARRKPKNQAKITYKKNRSLHNHRSYSGEIAAQA
ncbi:hypothetical protein [Aestuariirhabdus litorea]|nr:hypothetical protein [Aestuariirhabdus litorea]RWW98274.1 hypothetical protein DZC74_08210 [Endozoicomonadaceae bacterium GTF-13]